MVPVHYRTVSHGSCTLQNCSAWYLYITELFSMVPVGITELFSMVPVHYRTV